MAIFYVDESSFAYNIVRIQGYSRIGKLCYGFCDWNAKCHKNVVAALYELSIIGYCITKDNIDTNVFETWMRQY